MPSTRSTSNETSSNDIEEEEVVPIPNGLPHDASSTILLLTLPQKLAKEKRIREALLRCAVAGTLRLVTVDKAHQYTMHGREFATPFGISVTSYFVGCSIRLLGSKFSFWP